MSAYSKDNRIMEYYLSNIREHFSIEKGSIKSRNDLYVRRLLEYAWQTKDFYQFISTDKRICADGGWAVFVLIPDPYLYYFERFGVFPLIESSNLGTSEEYLQAIGSDPGGSPADAIAYRGETIVFAGRRGSAVYCFNEIDESTFEFRSRVPQPFCDIDGHLKS